VLIDVEMLNSTSFFCILSFSFSYYFVSECVLYSKTQMPTLSSFPFVISDIIYTISHSLFLSSTSIRLYPNPAAFCSSLIATIKHQMKSSCRKFNKNIHNFLRKISSNNSNECVVVFILYVIAYSNGIFYNFLSKFFVV
jgi:hypothetical protein